MKKIPTSMTELSQIISLKEPALSQRQISKVLGQIVKLCMSHPHAMALLFLNSAKKKRRSTRGKKI